MVLKLQILSMQDDKTRNCEIPSTNIPLNQNTSYNGWASTSALSIQRPNPATKLNLNKTPTFQPTIQPPYKPAPNYKNQGAIMKNDAPARIIPISSLNPYQGRWAIKARVTAKGDIHRYNNAKGDGKVFSFDLLDSDGGEIRVTCFNALVDRFYDIIEVGKVYIVSKGTLKPARKDFNHLSNEWEIFLDKTSTVDLCTDEGISIPNQKFNFVSISKIEETPNNSIVDLIGIVTAVNPSVAVLRKNGMETQRRIVNVKDISGQSVELTLWGEFCHREGHDLQVAIDSGAFSVVAVKAAKVSDFNGKSVSTISSTHLFINPDLPETHNLREWYNNGGKETVTTSISIDNNMDSLTRIGVRKNVSQIKDERLGMGDKPDWVTVKATICFIKTDNFFYTACPLNIGDRKCSKKVKKSSSGNWICDRCEKEFEECDYRYLLQVQVQDHTGMTWVTAFQESGEEILGLPAKELHIIKNEDMDDDRFAEIFKSCLFQHFLFKLKIKEEHYGDEHKVKVTVVKAERVDPSAECRFLLELVSKALG
jgi:replication factor A1